MTGQSELRKKDFQGVENGHTRPASCRGGCHHFCEVATVWATIQRFDCADLVAGFLSSKFFLREDEWIRMDEKTLRVLVADDERPIRRFLNVSPADSTQFWRRPRVKKPWPSLCLDARTLTVLDLGLPDMDGVEVTRRLREWTQIPIIVVSVRDREEDKIAALDAGADDYLTKPFSAGELMARLRVALRHTASRKANRSIEQVVLW